MQQGRQDKALGRALTICKRGTLQRVIFLGDMLSIGLLPQLAKEFDQLIGNFARLAHDNASSSVAMDDRRLSVSA